MANRYLKVNENVQRMQRKEKGKLIGLLMTAFWKEERSPQDGVKRETIPMSQGRGRVEGLGRKNTAHVFGPGRPNQTLQGAACRNPHLPRGHQVLLQTKD